jgi:hypothetical protein
MLTLATGLWRSGQVPRALPALLAVAAVAHIMSPGGLLGAVLTVPLLLAMAGLAARLWSRPPG